VSRLQEVVLTLIAAAVVAAAIAFGVLRLYTKS
jgi:hypothetical protein